MPTPEKPQLRSQRWFDNSDDPGMTALYIERYMNYGITRTELQSGKPIIGIAQTGSDLSPCNRHHLQLAGRVRDGIREAGGIPLEFPVYPIQETGKRPTAAMDRNLAYLGLVEVLHGYPIDGVVLTTGCDKTTPACLMAAATVNIPAIVLSGGPMLNGWWHGERAGSGTVIWEARKRLAVGEIDYEGFMEMVASSAPSVGHCNTMGTALSMNSLAEALGMSLPGCAAIPAPYRDRAWMAYETGRRIVDMVHENLRPSDILTKDAFDNAVVAAAALGASSNCPIHIIAIARHMGVAHSLDDWQRLGPTIPLLVDCQPAGRFLGEEFYRAGGVPAVMRELALAGKLHTQVMTVTGKTLADNLRDVPEPDREVIRAYDQPLRDNAGYVMLTGNLFDNAVIKTSVIDAKFRSRYLQDPQHPNRVDLKAIVFEGPEDYHARIEDPALGVDEQSILVIRNVGPGRLPGRPRGRQHAAAGRAHRTRHRHPAHHGRRAPERHVGEPLHPERVAGIGHRRRSRAAQDRRRDPAGPEHAARRRADPRRRAEGPARRLAPAPVQEPDPLGRNLPQHHRPARFGRLHGARDPVSEHHRDPRRGAQQPLTWTPCSRNPPAAPSRPRAPAHSGRCSATASSPPKRCGSITARTNPPTPSVRPTP
jgi:dihydroxy-acid dehydratase